MKFRVCLLLILSLSAILCAERYAILVGNSRGGHGYSTLKYVKNDILSVKNVFNEFCNFKEANILTLVNKSPEDLLTNLDMVKNKIDGNSKVAMFVFYYSGHADAEHLLMGNQVYPLSLLKKRLREMNSQINIAIFDACQSGSFTRLKGGVLQAPFLFKEESKIEGQIVLYSSSANEYSQESDLYKNSIFTFHFVNALRGCGDMSGDRKITLSEAYHYSYNHTVSSTMHSVSGVQHPGYQFKIQGEGKVIISDVNIRNSGIVLSKHLEGTILVLNRERNIVTELEKEPTSELTIALNPGTYEVINNRKGTIFKSMARVNTRVLTRIKIEQFKRIRSMPVYSKGGTKRPFLVGLTLSGGAATADYSRLQSQSNSYFSNYSLHNLYPSFSFPRFKGLFGLGIAFSIKNQFHVTVHHEYTRINKQYDYASFTVDPITQQSNKKALTIEDTLSLFAIRSGVGYSPFKGWFNRGTVSAGVEFAYINRNMSSTFSDQQFAITSKSQGVDFGYLIVPYVALDYHYPLHRKVDAGAQLLYRIQGGAKDLLESKLSKYDKNSEHFNFRYNAGGLTLNFFIRFMINRL